MNRQVDRGEVFQAIEVFNVLVVFFGALLLGLLYFASWNPLAGAVCVVVVVACIRWFRRVTMKARPHV